MNFKKYLLRSLMIVFLLIPSSFLFSQFGYDFGGRGATLLYIPDNGNSISIRKKSDFKFSSDLLLSWNTYYNARVSYSPWSNIYSSTSLMLIRPGNLTGAYQPKTNMVDFGIGVYYLKEVDNLIKKKSIFNTHSKWMMQNKGWLVNVLLGYSRGRILHESVGHFGRFDMNRFYGQMGIDFQTRLWGFAGTAKLGLLNYRDVILKGNASVDLINHASLLMDKNNFVFGEINLRFYMGIRIGQVYTNWIMTKVPEAIADYTDYAFGTIGVALDIQEIF